MSEIKHSVYFFYGFSTEDKLSEMIESALKDGCRFEQILSGVMPATGNKFLLNSGNPAMVNIFRLFVSASELTYKKLIAQGNNGVH